ncbi:hypothetical protein R0131_14470 [Clostridium sp. AL.422]|uniref:hypothetical protein n=1 Tax=Clostridium TaxID=1485 RepID=UPI00293DBE1E|nr:MULTISPECIES: hypothetical protein [unclassified Clostridium]MDV4152030.1 hypothetical protein [Clostridium sp. AL.422]
MNNIDIYYRIINLVLISLTYGTYKAVKKYKVKLIRIIMLSFSTTYFFTFICLEFNKYNNDDIKIVLFILSVITLILFFKSKQDIRAIKITELINSQDIWEHKEYIFNAKDFTDEEINIVEKVLKDIFYEVNKNLGYRKLGRQDIYIRKNKIAKSIRIVNILYYDNKQDINLLTSIYERVAKENYGEVNIKEGFITEVELRIII